MQRRTEPPWRQRKMKNKKQAALDIARCLPLVMIVAFAVIYFVFRDDITADAIKDFAPENESLAVLFMMLIGAAKGISVFCPFILIELIGALIFKDKVVAILVNTAAIAATFTSAYLVGRCSGSVMVDKLREKYPKFNDFYSLIKRNGTFSVFALRIIGVLPMDVVSMYFGASKISYPKYIVMSLLGAAPDLILETIIGAELKNYRSPVFWIAVACRLAFTAVTLLVYRVWIKKNKTKNVSGNEK